MKKYIPILLIIICILISFVIHVSSQSQGKEITQVPELKKKILLIPLDSRPPCKKLVADNGLTAGIDILVPPGEVMDFYTLPGETARLKEWLAREIPKCEDAIISIDQLLYGGLIASRNKAISDDDIIAVGEFLKKLHADNPTVKLHAFAILPRMNPPDYVEKYQDRKRLMEWSRLIHKYGDNPLSETAKKIQELESTIPAEQITGYKEIYNRNLRLNIMLASLLKDGILTDLTFGQDDGEAYSLPNLKLKEFMQYTAKHHMANDAMSIVHGADEVALSILNNIVAQDKHFKVYVDYSGEGAAAAIMPYMAISNDETVRERLAFHQDNIVDRPEEADYILFISAIEEETVGSRAYSAEKIKGYQQMGKAIALVDLSKNFSAGETLLPILINDHYPINSLIAYSGWNTTSNSIGTAIAQAEIYLTALKAGDCSDAVVLSNIRNLNNRICEDYYYLKDVIDLVNISLRKKGFTNVYDLDLEHNYKWAVDIMEDTMKQRLIQYKASPAFKKPFLVGNTQYRVTDLDINTFFPWPRTFEIDLTTKPRLEKK